MTTPFQVDLAWDAEALQGAVLAAVDALRAINTLAALRGRRQPPVTWRWLAAPGQRVPGSLPRPPVAASRRLPQLLLIPGWHARSGPDLLAHVQRNTWLAQYAGRTHAAGGGVMALYTGVILLASTGLLKEREAVTPWPFLPTLMRVSSDVRLRGDVAWTTQDRLWTGDSPALAMQVLFDALTQLPWSGTTNLAELAQAASPVLLHAPDRQQAGVQMLAQPIRRVPLGAVERARRHLEEHLDAPYDLNELAQSAATSPRTLLRHFEASLGKTPLAYLQGLRMARAKVLLETTYLPVEQVAQACGYTHVGTFRRLFSQATRQTPAAYRNSHRLRVRRPEWGREMPG